MKPEVWGPHTWIFLHTVTLGYPINPTLEDKIRFREFFKSIQYVLPCDKCRNNYAQHLAKIPLTDNALESRTSLFKWLVDIHNSVNQMNGKPTMDYDSVAEKYTNMYSDKPSLFTPFNILAVILLVLLVLGIIFKNYFINF